MRELEYYYQSKKRNGHTKTILMASFILTIKVIFLEKAQAFIRN